MGFGQCLAQIARNIGMDWWEFIALNDHLGPNDIFIGQIVRTSADQPKGKMIRTKNGLHYISC